MMKFEDMLAKANPGDEIVYHKGFHCMHPVKPVRNYNASQAWKAYLNGDVLLYQRRIAQDFLHYVAKVIR